MINTIIQVRRKLSKDFLWRNTVALMSGSIVSQFVILICTPILVHLYSPKAFGELALLMSIWGFFRILSTFNYELAIPIAIRRRDLYNLVLSSVLLLSLFTVILSTIILSFSSHILNLFGLSDSEFYLVCAIPIGILFIGFYQILLHLAIKLKKFGVISRSQVDQSIAGSLFSLSLFNIGPFSLLLGSILNQSFGIVRILCVNGLTVKNLRNIKFLYLRTRFHFSEILATYTQHYQLAWANTLAGVCNAIYPPICAYLFLSLADASALGCFYLSQKILAAPAALVSSSMGKVLFAELASEKSFNSFRYCINYARRVIKILGPLLLAYCIFSILVVPFIFRGEWDIALVKISILLLFPSCFLQTIATPTGMAFVTTNNNTQGLKAQLFMLIMRLIPLVVVLLIPSLHTSSSMIIATCIGLSLGYLCYIIVLWFTLKNH